MAKLFTVGADRKLVDRTPDGRGMSMPVGSLMWFAGATPPESWMICDGSAISRSTFSALFNVIGTTYGAGDGSTTFNLPDYRGRFIQGATVAGDVREAGLPNITGYLIGSNEPVILDEYNNMTQGGALYSTENILGGPNGESTTGAKDLRFDASKSNSIYGASNTVQPPAVTAIPCIKAFGSVVNDTSVPLSDLVVRSTIIYPNGGRAGAEANITTNKRIEMDNPFPGYFILCETQVFYKGMWSCSVFNQVSSTSSRGVAAYQVLPADKIVVQSGQSGLLGDSNNSGSAFGFSGSDVTTAPCRVVVHRMGEM